MNENILIVDDEPDILKTLENALLFEGYRITCANGGKAALEIFKQKPFDLVITDMRMPDMDGIQVIEQIKAIDPDVEIIVLTGYGTLDNAVSAFRDKGAFDYLTKPLENIESFFLTVRKALEKRQLKLDNRALVTRLKKKETELLQKNEVLRESERKYRELADFLSVFLFETDPDGKVTFLNPCALESFQYSREDLAKGLQIQDLMGPKCWEKFQGRIEDGTAETFSGTIESVAVRKDGTTFPVLVKMHPVFHDGRISGSRGLALDITDRKQRFEEMTRMAKFESLGTLAGGIAHDFNNILAVVLGNIELAQFDVAPETQAGEALSDAVEGCWAATELTGRFITFSAGGVPRKKTLSMAPLLNETVPLFFSGSNVKCQLQIPENLWPAHVDQGQMTQAIHNVVANAKEAMRDGGTVKLRAENLEIKDHGLTMGGIMPKGRYIKIEVQDEGSGISKDQLNRVMDPYFTTKERGTQKGMGLGLSTSFSIVKKHNGFMFMASEKTVGTTVSIYLPATPLMEKEIKADSEPSIVAGVDVSLKNIKVLLMDDEKMLRDMGTKMLKRFGCRVDTAKNGTEAVEMYKTALKEAEPFDLVLLDLTVKGGPGGKPAMGELVKLDPYVKAVVCSGYADDPVMSNFEAYGFRASLPKPFLKQSLESVVRKALI
ncbi:MAG: response regulator [Deltaproteobacteria bacterium]|nr:response regulator [Deltaproteobacteria bacterium]